MVDHVLLRRIVEGPHDWIRTALFRAIHQEMQQHYVGRERLTLISCSSCVCYWRYQRRGQVQVANLWMPDNIATLHCYHHGHTWASQYRLEDPGIMSAISREILRCVATLVAKDERRAATVTKAINQLRLPM